MPHLRVTVSGKVTDTGEPQDKSRQITRQELDAGNVRDAIVTALDRAGLDGFATGEFSVKVTPVEADDA